MYPHQFLDFFSQSTRIFTTLCTKCPVLQSGRFYDHSSTKISSKFEADAPFTRDSIGIAGFHFMSEIASFFMMHCLGYQLPLMHIVGGASFPTSN